jgi:signal transduction histidine kinase
MSLGTSVIVTAASVSSHRTGWQRRGPTPPGSATLATFALILAISGLNRLFDVGWDVAVLVGYDVVIAGSAIVLAVGLQLGWSAPQAADLLVGASTEEPTGLERALRTALGDPSLRIGYWSPSQQTYVDETGTPTASDQPGKGRATLRLQQDGAPLALVSYDMAVGGDPELLRAVVAAVRLVAGNVRHQAEIRARTQELHRSRARLVTAVQEARSQLSAEITTGPVRTLTRAIDLLRLVPTGVDAPAADEMQAVQALASVAREDMIRFADGLEPKALDETGFTSAISGLAQDTPIDVEVQIAPDVANPPYGAQSAAYFVCCEALTNAIKHAHAYHASVSIRPSSADLVVVVEDDGIGGARPHGPGLRGLRDRLETLGGSLTIADRDGRGTRLTARIPRTDR